MEMKRTIQNMDHSFCIFFIITRGEILPYHDISDLLFEKDMMFEVSRLEATENNIEKTRHFI